MCICIEGLMFELNWNCDNFSFFYLAYSHFYCLFFSFVQIQINKLIQKNQRIVQNSFGFHVCWAFVWTSECDVQILQPKRVFPENLLDRTHIRPIFGPVWYQNRAIVRNRATRKFAIWCEQILALISYQIKAIQW